VNAGQNAGEGFGLEVFINGISAFFAEHAALSFERGIFPAKSGPAL
jgi:hypothetical protein